MFSDTPGHMISFPIFIYLFIGLFIGLGLMTLVLQNQLKKTP